ncbi:MAG: efflux RND transporter periplasmic adaptor subunit [Gammaproteobacteria bacterium]
MTGVQGAVAPLVRCLAMATMAVAVTVAADDALEVSAEQRALLDIATAPVAAADAVTLDHLAGEISLPIASSSALTAPQGGVVLQVLVEAGERVQAGDVLAVIDSRELATARADLVRARAERNLAASRLARDEALLAEGVIPQARVEAVRAELAARSAEVTAATARLGGLAATHGGGRYHLVAPMEATVVERRVAAGEPIETYGVAFLLLADAGLRVDFWLPSEFAAVVAPGQLARVGALEARVDGRAAAIDPETQLLAVRASVAPGSGLLPGQRVSVSFDLPAPAGAVSVPRAALVQVASGAVVYRSGQGDRIEPVAVTVHGESAGQAVVAGTLAVGEAVVIRGTAALRAMAR